MLDTAAPGAGGELKFTGASSRLHFKLTAYNGAHDGAMQGDLALVGAHASFESDGCRLGFDLDGKHIHVQEQSEPLTCGEPLGVAYSGTYITTAEYARKPKPDLLTYKALDSTSQNVAAHALLGSDYKTLVDTLNLGDSETDADGLGTKVGTYFVRGLAPTNASIIMSRGDQLWIGLLITDSQGHVRQRYYTNVDSWKRRIPRTIQAWHDSIDKTIPIDMMQ